MDRRLSRLFVETLDKPTSDYLTLPRLKAHPASDFGYISGTHRSSIAREVLHQSIHIVETSKADHVSEGLSSPCIRGFAHFNHGRHVRRLFLLPSLGFPLFGLDFGVAGLSVPASDVVRNEKAHSRGLFHFNAGNFTGLECNGDRISGPQGCH
jgi:hypothetical protein